MKPDPIISEILIVKSTTFSKRQLSEKISQHGTENLSLTEQLEAACWNGLLVEMLPEIVNKSCVGKKIFLWQIDTRNSFLRLNFGASSPVFEKEYVLDPHSFLSNQEMN